MRGNKRTFSLFSTGIIIATLISCSLDQLAVGAVSNLVGGTTNDTVFSGESDPIIAGEALPFSLKLYELLLSSAPKNDGLLLTTGKGFIAYANLFVQRPAERLPDSDIELRISELARAKNHYLRARNYLLAGLEIRYPGFRKLFAAGQMSEIIALVDSSSIDYLFWLGASSLGALTTDPLDIELLITSPYAIALIEQVTTWDDSYQSGSAHEILLSYYGSTMTQSNNGMQRVERHFAHAVAAADGARAGPYVAMAGIAIKMQDQEHFRDLLIKALNVELEEPRFRLQNVLDQQYAQWLLDHMEDFFVEL